VPQIHISLFVFSDCKWFEVRLPECIGCTTTFMHPSHANSRNVVVINMSVYLTITRGRARGLHNLAIEDKFIGGMTLYVQIIPHVHYKLLYQTIWLQPREGSPGYSYLTDTRNPYPQLD